MHRPLSLLLSLLLLFSCQRSLQPENYEVYRYTMSTAVQPESDEKLDELIAPFREQLEAKMNIVIGQAAVPLTKQRPESTLGNWIGDLTLQQSEKVYGASIDFAICNYGGLRINEIPAGPITKGRIFELMPFENMMIILKVDGKVVQQFFDHMAMKGGWPISRTAKYQIKGDKAVNVSIKGAPISEDKIYKIALTDFIANGGDKCSFFIDQPRENLDLLFRDLIFQFIEEETAAGRACTSVLDGRVNAER